MKKKLLVLCLALCLVASAFVGCASDEATPPEATKGLAIDSLGNITWDKAVDAAAWKVQYKLGDAEYKDYGIIYDNEITVTDILASIAVADLKAANAKNMSVQVAAVDSENEVGAYTELADVLGTGKKLRTVTTLAELKEVGDKADYVVLANDIILDNEAVQAAIVYSTCGIDEVPTDESAYYIGRRLFNGTLNGLGHTIAYTLDDTDNLRTDKDVRTEAAGKADGGKGEHAYGWAGIWEKVEGATLMNLKIDADITKPHSQDPYFQTMEWATSVYAHRTLSSTVYNCDFVGEYHITSRLNSGKNFRWGLGAWECASNFIGCTFNLKAWDVDGKQGNNQTSHSCGIVKWSLPDNVKFTDCIYYVNVAVDTAFNPFADGKSSFAENCRVEIAPLLPATEAAE